jgi:N-acetyl-1-D-myo-inositol-2-amino-2-deoxy-alpha-D-glucopyranoside deacetylase
MTQGGLLVVTAHPDDEVLIAGGTLAACAMAGLPTGVVCLTRGELGPIADRRFATRKTLPAVRRAELKEACARLGVGWVKSYRRQDGNLRWSDGPTIVRQLTRILETRRPDAVITFGEDGLYHHPDHIATYRYTVRAVTRTSSRPVLYRSAWPSGLAVGLARELSDRGMSNDLWDFAPHEFGTDDLQGVFGLDLRAFTAQKLDALRCHRTQLGDGHALSAVPTDLAERFLGIEWFAVVPTAGAAAPDWIADAVVAAGSRVAPPASAAVDV